MKWRSWFFRDSAFPSPVGWCKSGFRTSLARLSLYENKNYDKETWRQHDAVPFPGSFSSASLGRSREADERESGNEVEHERGWACSNDVPRWRLHITMEWRHDFLTAAILDLPCWSILYFPRTSKALKMNQLFHKLSNQEKNLQLRDIIKNLLTFPLSRIFSTSALYQ